jgi:hypothetical protein
VNQKSIGYIVEGAGVIAVVAGAIAGFHHLAFSLPVLLGVVAIYVGRKIAAGGIVV